MLTGNWRNFQELEDSLSLPELEAIVAAKRRYDSAQQRFNAALQGHDIPDPEQEAIERRFNEIKREAIAERQGTTGEEVLLREAGVVIETE